MVLLGHGYSVLGGCLGGCHGVAFWMFVMVLLGCRCGVLGGCHGVARSLPWCSGWFLGWLL